jgi:hypothetical protein
LSRSEKDFVKDNLDNLEILNSFFESKGKPTPPWVYTLNNNFNLARYNEWPDAYRVGFALLEVSKRYGKESKLSVLGFAFIGFQKRLAKRESIPFLFPDAFDEWQLLKKALERVEKEYKFVAKDFF